MFIVKNMKSPRSGCAVAHQFEITLDTKIGRVHLFQSYSTPIAMRVHDKEHHTAYYIATSTTYSRTTSKYQKIFYEEYGKGTIHQYNVPNLDEWVEVLNIPLLFNQLLLDVQGASTKCIEK